MDTGPEILAILDECCDAFTFPMLDNGYVYLAATRLTLFRSDSDWGMTVEVFGYSVREGEPSTYIHAFGSRVEGRPGPEGWVSQAAYESAMASSPNHWHRHVTPFDSSGWVDPEDNMLVRGATLVLRGKVVPIPQTAAEYAEIGVELEEPSNPGVHEVCRWLAAVHRSEVLATGEELAQSFHSSMRPILQLDEWHHPDVVDESSRPSGNQAFQQLARVLETGDISCYQPTLAPNTHWENWPEGGTL